MVWNFPSSLPVPDNLSAALSSYTDTRGLFAILVAVVVLLYGVSVGRTKALLSLLSIFVAYTLVLTFPFDWWLERFVSEPDRPLIPAALFVVLYLVVFLLMGLSALRVRLTLGELSIPKVLLISVIQLGLLASIALSLLPESVTSSAVGAWRPYLASKYALFAWSAVAVLLLPFMREKHSRSMLE